MVINCFIHTPIVAKNLCPSKCTHIARSKAKGLVLWIERAGSLPLTLFFCHNRMYESASGNLIVKVLNRYVPRWETLYLHQRHKYSYFGTRWNPLDMFCFEKWSSLQRMYGVSPHETIPWAQLTHLKLYCPHYAQVADIFEGCRKLVWLSLPIIATPLSFNMPASPIGLHHLSFLSFSTKHVSAIIQLVSLPSLRAISICDLSDLDRQSFDSLLRFFTRSACTLD